MAKLRQLLAANMKAYRNELGLSQAKLAEKVDTATNYIAMIEGEKRFPTDAMLERIAAALEKDPPDLFAIAPIQQKWQDDILAELECVIQNKRKAFGQKSPKH
ncbi:helix-turn-helix transcriptional regulator [Treponema primitia]|uniref:helix-turn-helix domain-containing protein n=1 Tax=Treponema primitia TaxID=88058 RepID=UPI00397FBBAD